MKKTYASIIALIAFFSASAYAQMEVQGNFAISDNPDTSEVEGNLDVQNNAVIGKILKAKKIILYPYGTGALLIGENSTIVDGKIGITLGVEASVSGNGAMAIGYKAIAEGNSSLAVGSNAKASKGSSAALGSSAQALGDSSIALGANAKASGASGVALGTNVTAEGNFAVASGSGSIAKGDGSIAGGVNSSSKAKTSMAFGKNVVANSFCQVTVGQMNANFDNASTDTWILTDPLFVVGNGFDQIGRNNAFVIYKNGNGVIDGVLRTTTPSDAIPMGEFGAPEASGQ